MICSKVKGALRLVSVVIACTIAINAPVFAMSVTLKNGETYKAEMEPARDNEFKIERNGTNEIVMISDVGNIDFSGEDSKLSQGQDKTSSVKLSAIAADVKAIIDKVPDKSKFPNAGGYVIEDEDTYILNPDGSYKIRSHYIFKIFEDRAINSDITLSYAFERESVKIVMARTIQEDGSVRYLDPKDVKNGDMFGGAQFYSNTYKVLSATLPDVKKGSITEQIIELNVFKPIIEGYFCPTLYFVAGEPKRHCRYEIRAPKDKKLKYASKNFDAPYDKNFEPLKSAASPKISETANEIVYLFEAFDIAEFISEPYMPAYTDVAPAVQFSSYETWDKIYEWFDEKFSGHLSEISDQMKKKVFEITAKCKTTEEKIAAIYHYIQQQNRYISIKGDLISGLSGHPARRTFENQYGDCVDKAILMSAMLKIAGVESYPTLINAGGGELLTSIAHLDLNHSISLVKYDSKEIFLDSTSQDSRFPFFRVDDHDRYNMVPQLKRLIKTGMPQNEQKSYRKVVISAEGGMDIIGTRLYGGAFESSVRSANKSLKESEIKDKYKQRLNATLPGVTLKKLEYSDFMDLSVQLTEKCEYEAPNAAIIAGDLMLFSVPGYSFNFEEIGLKDRKYPIDYQYLIKTENTFEFIIPEGYEIKYLPPKISVENRYMNFYAGYEIKDRVTAVFSDRFERKARVVAPADYDAYRKDLEKLVKYSGEKVVIEKLSKK